MTHPWHIWTVFGLCLGVVLAAMGWISMTIVRLDRAEALAMQHADREEVIRLALWRMDSALGPLVSQVSGLPYFVYKPFYPADRGYTQMFNEAKPAEISLPSPLLTHESPYILLYFQFGPDGQLVSPQVPTGDTRDLAEAAYTTGEKIETAASRLAELRRVIDPDTLLAALPSGTSPALAMAWPPERAEPLLPAQQAHRAQSANEQIQVQRLRSAAERQARVQQQLEMNTANVELGNFLLGPAGVTGGAIKPLWFGDVLLLARRVSVRGEEYVQGCWLDWPRVKQWLCAEVRDLLPKAQLEPIRSEPPADDVALLAALPAKLVPGEVPTYSGQPTSPLRASLLVAWVCVLLAAIAVASLLVGTVSLSERRATFVSAVTHEMRTPLTTFRMYTDMLLKDMIPSEEKRRRYLTTLRTEAHRLGHLVENVLAYARLERSRDRQPLERLTLRELTNRVKDRLTARVDQAEMKLMVEVDESVSQQRVRVDTSAVEQILFNLVDNACKYATAGSERLIHLEASYQAGQSAIQVRDHGPGVSETDLRRLFRPFCKSARDAANSSPGVGLGLALSRRLARSMGGDLRLNEGYEGGAGFVLTLPTA
jgi:signal transduction histidine kinase